jgi:outer membrane lipoprotein-sorting protein
MWFALVMALSMSTQDSNEAEQLFQKIEAKLDKAKSLNLSFETVGGEAALRNGQRLKGTLAVMRGNKLRLQVRAGKKRDRPFEDLQWETGDRDGGRRGRQT